MITATNTTTDRTLYRLLAWLSPSFPVGAYGYSHGIEYAVETELVKDRNTLSTWIEGILRFGAGRLDGAFLASAWRAVRHNDEARLVEVARRAAACRATAESALESSAQGLAFVTAVEQAWSEPQLTLWLTRLRAASTEPSHAVVVGTAAAADGLPLDPVLYAYLAAFAANLVSAGVRLIPLGQGDGQRTIAWLEPAVTDAARVARHVRLDDLGAATLNVDWTSARHETQYTRLFRS